jgi:hypothetical protein
MVSFAQRTIGMTSVGLKAMLVVSPRMEVVDELRPPAGRRELGAHLLGECEVGVLVLAAVAGQGATAVEQPVEEPEDETVAQPDQSAGGEEWPGRLRDRGASDQIGDQDGGRRHGHYHERENERDR